MRSPDTIPSQRAPLRPLLVKELRGVATGRALWTMLLLVCPLIGYSYFQALSLYADASIAGQQSPVLAASLSPLDGVLVPTFGASYVAITLLFPFVAIRVLGREKETGVLRLLIQLPYRSSTLIAAKLAAILAAWCIVSIPVLCSLVLWTASGGHLALPETANLVAGHLIYGLLIGAIGLFAASISDSAATAAIVTLAFTIGSWVLDFTVAGQPGWMEWLARLSLTLVLRPFEHGLLPIGLIAGAAAVIGAFVVLAGLWMPPGVSTRIKFMRSAGIIIAAVALVSLASQITTSIDVTEDRRNSFATADQRTLAKLGDPLSVTVHLAPEDPRYLDLNRDVLAKLKRVMPNVAIRLAARRQSFTDTTSDESYGAMEFAYGGRTETTRSTSPSEILPLLYGLAGVDLPVPMLDGEYPGYPLIADSDITLAWYFGGLPLLIVIAWWWSRRPPPIIHHQSLKEIKP